MSSRIAASFRANALTVVVFAVAPCVEAPAGCATHGPANAVDDTNEDARDGAIAVAEGEGEGTVVVAGEGEGEGTVVVAGEGEGEGEGEGDGATTPAPTSGVPAGWLFTTGNRIHISLGAGASSPWIGRGVNLTDIYHCGGNGALTDPDPTTTMLTVVDGLMTDWKPNFVRVSLAMNSYPGQDIGWVDGEGGASSTYKAAMTTVVRALGSHPGTFVLVTLRSHASMILRDASTSIPEATNVPSSAATTPDAARFPHGTDDEYRALVQTFAHDSFVAFGVANEPGGDTLPFATIHDAMAHAVAVIRAEEDALGVPHHLVSVQGRNWTKDVSGYQAAPIPSDNVVYEVHGYPPLPLQYGSATLPVIVGEYGSLQALSARLLFADFENKQVTSLAWVFEPFVDCQPDLLDVSARADLLVPSTWGSLVRDYLRAHAL